MTSGKNFDWIFFVIIGLPFIIGLVGLIKPGLLELFVQAWPWEKRNARHDVMNDT